MASLFGSSSNRGDNSEGRSINNAQITRLIKEVSEQQANQMAGVLETLVTSFKDFSLVKLDELDSLNIGDIADFLFQYERLTEVQKGLVSVAQKLFRKVFQHLKILGKTDTDRDIFTYLKEKVQQEKTKNLKSAEDLIKKCIYFNEDILEEEEIVNMFKEVDELLEIMPSGAEMKPRLIAEAIFEKLPDYVWIRKEDLRLKPELKQKNRDALMDYVLDSLPPLHVRSRFKSMNKTKSKKSKPKVKVGAVDTLGQKMPSKLLIANLCTHCYEYGHKEAKCFAKRNGNPKSDIPTEPELRQKWEKYKERRRKGRAAKKLAAKVGGQSDGNILKPVSQQVVSGKENISESVPSGPLLEPATDIQLFTGQKAVRRTLFNPKKLNMIKSTTVLKPNMIPAGHIYDYSELDEDAEVEVYFEEGGEKYTALLDSGAFKSAMNLRLRKYCSKTITLDNPFAIKVAGGRIYWVFQLGILAKVIVCLDGSCYIFTNVECMLMDVPQWDDLIIGNDQLRAHGLDHLMSLRQKLKKGKKLSQVQGENALEYWLEETTIEVDDAAVEPRGVFYVNQSDYFYDALSEDLYYEKDIFYDSLDKKETQYISVNELILPKKLMKKDPVIFAEQDDEVNFEIIDEEASLDISSEEDIKGLTTILEDKIGSLNLEYFDNDLSRKDELLELLRNNVRTFGDSESPTSLSNLTPIECELKEGRSVGVLNQYSLGYEQENFLLRRIQQMLDAGIIEANPNPTTAMSTLVAPKKAPKKFRIVVDFRPLNDATRKSLTL
eukprot:snap_masked-scaffold_94-processed-gene-0.5-mRNA-1 protein AED:1.00 eAED:1.00 QI:0/0/0/0/1/1/2/0/774